MVFEVDCESSELNFENAVLDTQKLEFDRGRGNSRWSGEMRRYREEHRWRKRSTGSILTLMDES